MRPPQQSAGGGNPGDERPESLHEQLVAKAIADFLDLRSQGRGMDLETFCRLHPDLQDDLRADLETISRIEQALGPDEEAEAVREPSEPLPDRLSGNRILGVIGSGGMGTVLLALDEGLGRKVAIKILSPKYREDAAVRSRFMHEARAMARLSHPNIVRIYKLGQPEEIPNFVMEYLEGVPLVAAAQPLHLQQKMELFHKAVLAVEFLHRNQILHRDLKPGNILVGTDLEPRLLDFGLAQQVKEKGSRLTQAGQVMGTPDYFSPEQARGDPELDARSDIFSLGAILYELLTGVVPFRADTFPEQVREICEREPMLPRRINAAVPGALQNICLKCLEKNPRDRYSSARELAEDIGRFLTNEPVQAIPTSYSRLLTGKAEQHLRELSGWRQDRILSDYEFDSFRKLYDRLFEKEDAWILEVRRLSVSQVTLYLGAWVLVVGAALLLLFRYRELSGTPAVLLVSAATAPMGIIGMRCWKSGQLRISIAYLLAFCLLLPTTILVGMKEWRILTHFSQGKESLELFASLPELQESAITDTTVKVWGPTNAQMWWAFLLSLPAYLALRRFTGASVFSLVLSFVGALLCVVTLLRMGMLDWIETDQGRIFFRLVPFAALYFVIAYWIERLRCHADSRYFYPIAVIFTYTALSGVAGFHKPYADYLAAWVPRTRGQVEYLFLINAGIYLALQTVCERVGTAQMRSVAKSFRFVIPGHVLLPTLLLGIFATSRWEEALQDAALRREARFFEILLPVVACLFVFGSVPKQMKNFFASGLLFLAIGIVRLQQDLFKHNFFWPASLLILGTVLMVVAANYTSLKLAATRWMRRARRISHRRRSR
jgi:serine/threonine protein kinase